MSNTVTITGDVEHAHLTSLPGSVREKRGQTADGVPIGSG